MLKDYGFGGGWGIAISSTCKDPERAFDFIDWICSEDAQILVNWGLEGVNYNVVNGKRVVPPAEQALKDTDVDYGKKTGVGRWAYPFPQLGQGFIDSTGNYITTASPETLKQNYLPIEKETLAAYGVDMWTDLYPSSEALGVSKHGQAWQYTLPPDLNAKISEADDYSKVTISNLVLGRPADFDAGWAKFMQGLKDIGIEDANKALTVLVKDKIKLWSGN
jgi:putative aldouronate transport system substrate-binding protein